MYHYYIGFNRLTNVSISKQRLKIKFLYTKKEKIGVHKMFKRNTYADEFTTIIVELVLSENQWKKYRI